MVLSQCLRWCSYNSADFEDCRIVSIDFCSIISIYIHFIVAM